MTKANTDIREAAKSNKVPLWAIAAEKGMHEITLIRKLRFELSPEEKSSIFAIISALKSETTDIKAGES